MNIGVLIEYTEETIAKFEAEKRMIVLGVSAESILADIEYFLWKSGYDPARTLQLIHHDLLKATGRIADAPKVPTEGGANVRTQ